MLIKISHGFKFSTLFSLMNFFLLSIRQDFYVFLQRNQITDFFVHLNFAFDRKYLFSRHFNFVVVRKNRFSRHFNFAVFRPRPRNREIFMPRNFHSIKYYINTRNFLHTYGLGDVACASSILLSFLKVNLNLVLSILNLINFVILFL